MTESFEIGTRIVVKSGMYTGLQGVIMGAYSPVYYRVLLDIGFLQEATIHSDDMESIDITKQTDL